MPTKTKSKNPRLSDLLGTKNPLVSRIRAKWESFKEQMRIPTMHEIQTLKKRVHNLEKKFP
jgi:hypothetical protein